MLATVEVGREGLRQRMSQLLKAWWDEVYDQLTKALIPAKERLIHVHLH